MTKISVLNLGISNLTSVLNVLDYAGLAYDLVDDEKGVKSAQKLLLPGVGTFASGMKVLHERNVVEAIREQVLQKKVPVFGICLGMQLLFENGEEAVGVEGLSLLAGSVIQLPESPHYQMPRIGWADSEVRKDFLGLKIGDKADFYYIHSFHAMPKNREIITITSDNGAITAAVQSDNIYGCQFHPEKSYIHGIKIIKEFGKI